VFGRRKRRCMQILCKKKEGLQPHALQDKPATLLSFSHPLHRPSCPTRDHQSYPTCKPTWFTIHLHLLLYNHAGHPSPSCLAHYAPLTFPYQFLRLDIKLSTCAAKEKAETPIDPQACEEICH
jgi:hypothetical protein